ncbi:MAG: DUF1684 domain-containing protein [Planctomycetota bacterium]
MDTQTWAQEIEASRQQKDQFFALHPQSPIPLEDRAAFSRLAYYPPDPAYRFDLELREHAEKDVSPVQDTGGNVRPLIRWGEFRFKIDGDTCALQAYKNDAAEGRLFVPFRDATSGSETYGAGRYLDLEPEANLTEDGRWVVDLNAAYNPWCAYSERYVCPFVPPENWLSVAVRAGEKQYPLTHAEER